jgi:hypothetical protein
MATWILICRVSVALIAVEAVWLLGLAVAVRSGAYQPDENGEDPMLTHGPPWVVILNLGYWFYHAPVLVPLATRKAGTSTYQISALTPVVYGLVFVLIVWIAR